MPEKPMAVELYPWKGRSGLIEAEGREECGGGYHSLSCWLVCYQNGSGSMALWQCDATGSGRHYRPQKEMIPCVSCFHIPTKSNKIKNKENIL